MLQNYAISVADKLIFLCKIRALFNVFIPQPAPIYKTGDKIINVNGFFKFGQFFVLLY